MMNLSTSLTLKPEYTFFILPPKFLDLLQQDGFIIFLSGKKGKGKTNFSLFITEFLNRSGIRKLFASNIPNEAKYVEYIDNMPDLKTWLHTKGKKLYILDELGKHARKLRFMSGKNIEIMDIVQLIRHYDCGLMGLAPSPDFIDSLFLNTDILDAQCHKETQDKISVIDNLHETSYTIHKTPATRLTYDSKHEAIFTVDKKFLSKDLPLCCQVAGLYAETQSYKVVGNTFDLKKEQIRREIVKHIKHGSHASQ